MDFDPLHGDLAYDLVLSDWRPVGEIRYPFRQHYEMAGVKLMEFQVVDAVFNPSLDETLFAVPESIRASAATTAKTARANVPYLWILRRQMIGSYNDVENLTHDPNTTTSAAGRAGARHFTGARQYSSYADCGDEHVSDRR